MPVGDSITAGYTDNPNWTVPFQFGYRSALYELLNSNGIPVQFVGYSPEPWNGLFGLPTNQPSPDLRKVVQDQHEGYGGQGTTYVAANIASWLAIDRPDVVLLMIGINDIGAGQTGAPTSVQTALSNIVQTIVANRPKTHVIVAQIIPYATQYTPATYEYNDYIRSVLAPAFAARGYHVASVDQYSHFVADPAGLTANPARYSNGINHPDAVAYGQMAQTWFAGIAAALGGGPAVVLGAPATTQEASPGTVIAINATNIAGAHGSAVRMQLLANGVLQSEVAGGSLSTIWQVPVRGLHRLTVRAIDAQGNSGERLACVLGTPPADGPGGVTNGLRVWLKAEAGVVFGSGKSVLRWEDQSGNLNHAAQASAALQPKFVEGLFGLGPGLRFDGSRYLTSTNGMPTGSYTKVVRFFASNTSTANGLVGGATAGSVLARGHALSFAAGQQTLRMSHNGTFALCTNNAPLAQPVTAFATYDATTSAGEIYLDNLLCGSGPAPGDNTITSYQIGAIAGGLRLNGAISDVLIYDRVLSAGERQVILSYLDDKYRTPFQLWQKQHFPPGDPLAAPDADASGDGLPNAVKYALALVPTANNAGSDHLPRVQAVANIAEVAYRRATDRPDVLCYLESSPDLQTWTSVSDMSLGVTESIDTRVFSTPIPPGAGVLFVRLRVVLHQ
jgi:lysophospholipase L1-like esterase